MQEEGMRALTALGWNMPEGASALLGLDPDMGGVPGAMPLPLRPVTETVWWAGPRPTLLGWCRQVGIVPQTRWRTQWRTAAGLVELARPRVMGILNVTPDSFSDGGRYPTRQAQEERVQALLDAGADWIDVGGESTRPGHVPVDADVEWKRLEPLLTRLPLSVRTRLSVDTRHAAVAERAAALGVCVINDVSGLLDPALRRVADRWPVGLVYMFNRPAVFGSGDFDLGAVMGEMHEALSRLATLPGGLERVAVDPGLGFAYGGASNLAVLRNLELFRLWGRPVVVGGSRKRFLGGLTGRPVESRDAASVAMAAISALRGADIVRAHAVAETVDAVRVAEGLARFD